MSAASSSTMRPPSQPRDQLVLQVENVALAGRLLTIAIFEVQNVALTKGTGTPSSPLRSTPSTPSTPSSSARTTGFRVAARDDVENEYSLFVTRQKAEYLYGAAYPVEAAASALITPEAMANGILAHLNIIGNRQRDVGKLICREPEPHVEKKTRVLPVSTPPHKQKNPHLPSKRQDQRAVRVQKTSKRTMEAVAQAMRRPDPDWSGDNESAGSEVEAGTKIDRKGSEASLLHRMAVADSKTMWKAELETNYEESEHPSLFESDTSTATQEYALAPGLSPVKRALPERKTKHKDLEERRQKGRHQRILIAQAAQESPSSTQLGSIQAQASYSVMIEETEQDVDLLSPGASRRTSLISVSSTEKAISQPRPSSAPRSSVIVGNAYGLKNLPNSDAPEPEQFLRRRTLDAHRSVLKNDHWPDDIPGMGIEITDERPTLQTPPNQLDALLNTARRVMLMNSLGSTLERKPSNVKLRKSNRTTTSPTLSLYSTALNSSNSAPILQSPKVEKVNVAPTLASDENSTGPQLKAEIESNIENKPQLRSKSTSAEASNQPRLTSISPIPPMMNPEPFQNQVDDKSPRPEDILTPKPSASSISDCEEMPSKSRPRSNSVGSEGVVRLAPLPRAIKPSVQEFLTSPEAKTTDSTNAAPQCEVVLEQEAPALPLDPDVVLYPPKDFTSDTPIDKSEGSVDGVSTASKLSFEEVKEEMRESENSSLPNLDAVTMVDVAVQGDQTNASQQVLLPTSAQDVVSPPTTRKGCWEDPVLAVTSSETPEETIEENPSTIAATVVASPPETEIEVQQNSVKEDGLEIQPESAMAMPSQLQGATLEEQTSEIQQKELTKLQEMLKNVIPDSQIQRSKELPADSEDHSDQYESGSNDTPIGSGEILVCPASDIINDAERIADKTKGVVDIIDDITSGTKESEGSSSSVEYHADPLQSKEGTGSHEVSTDRSVDDDGDHGTKVLESPVVCKDLGGESTKSPLHPIADSPDETIFPPLGGDEKTGARKLNAIARDDDPSPTADSRENFIQLAKLVLPYEEPGSEMLSSQDEDSNQEREKDIEVGTSSSQQITPERLQKTGTDDEMKAMDQSAIPEFIAINSKVRATAALPVQQKQLPIESFPEREKPSGILRKKSMSPSKKSGPTGQVKTTSKVLGSRRRSTVAQKEDTQVVTQPTPKFGRRHTTEDVQTDDLQRGMRRTSTIDPSGLLPGLPSATAVKTAVKVPTENNSGPGLRSNNTRQVPSNRHSSQYSGVAQSVTNYHKKWGKWITGKNIIEKVGCLQLEELVMADPRNEDDLLRLGLRYARWPGTSMAAILLLEHAALLHKNAAGSRDYWFWLGSAHLDIFMRHRKYLPIARFHLSKSLRAFTSAFAYLESLVDPMLLLRYAIGLFWHKGDGNLEKTRDIFQELFSQFVSFCDKDRPNLLFLQFQVLHRLKLYVDAIDCMNKIITLHDSLPHQATPTGVPILSSASTMPHFAVYDAADYRLMLMQCQQTSGNYVSAAQSLAWVLKLKGVQQDAALKDEEYFDLWFSLAEKCFHHEDYVLALEYYAIALNFAKQSQVLAAIHNNLGLCFHSLGEDNKCVTEYKRARTANRHVPPLASLTEISTPYDERFAQLLQKSVVQTIEEVRVELYGRAVRRLQRVFRKSRKNLNINLDSNSSDSPLTKMPSLSKRRLSIAAARNPPALVKIEASTEVAKANEEESLPQKIVAVDDNQASRYEDSTLEVVERRHESFLARKQAAMDEIAELLTNPQYRGRESSPLSRSNARPKAATQLRSGLLSPEKDRLDARRTQSMETFHQLGYISSTMPWIEFWEKLLVLAPDLFESRQALYGSIARIRGRLPLVTDEVAFCALAESIGNVYEAAEKLHDTSHERELTYVCAVIEVSKQLERDFPLGPAQLSIKPPHVSLPTISSPRATHGSHSPVGALTSRHVVLPPYSPTHATIASISKPKKHLRMNQMLNLHFQEHVQKQEAAIAIAEATGGFVQPQLRTEKLMVLQNFRQANAVLLSSQLAFGSEKAAT